MLILIVLLTCNRRLAGPVRRHKHPDAGGGVTASGGGASESVGLYTSNDVSEPNKPDTEQAKIDAHLEQQHRKAETSPTDCSPYHRSSLS